MHWTKDDIKKADKLERLNLINSLTGIKPGNLIGTISKGGQENLAIFSSIVHLGSDPALFGFITRPTNDVPRNTYENIKETGVFTINHVHVSFIKNAHYTSVKFPREMSEFHKCGLTPEYRSDFEAPYVKSSLVQLGMRFVQEIPITVNNTILVIGEIEHIFLPDKFLEQNGHINLEKLGSAGISGLNSYYSVKKLEQFPYARFSELPEFDEI
jgi:flavin reductase (DIM6/NTAB) family NADH-FMN oxidoreductase RutF